MQGVGTKRYIIRMHNKQHGVHVNFSYQFESFAMSLIKYLMFDDVNGFTIMFVSHHQATTGIYLTSHSSEYSY